MTRLECRQTHYVTNFHFIAENKAHPNAKEHILTLFFSRTRRRIAHHYIKNKKIKKGLKKTRKQEKQKKQNRGWGWEYQLCTGVLRAAPTTSNPRATTSWDPLHQPFPKTWYYLESLRGSYWCLGRPPQRHKHSCVSIATMPLESPRNWSPFFLSFGHL